jgi:LysR family transcriptional regulator, glycine cleavage system transcriptional activator
MLLDLESLNCFVRAATSPSFRSAARRVALSPAAFGDRIRRLEDELGSKLFQRTTRRVGLTAAGARLLPQARRCLEEAERCRAVIGSEQGPPFDLVIGTRFELGMSWLVPVLGKLERSRPARRLHVCFGDTPDIVPRILRDEIDCMITSARLVAPGLGVARLHEEEYVFVGANVLLKKRPFARAEDAARHVLIDVSGDLPLFRYFLDARPARELWSFERVQHLGGIGAIRARVLEGAGVAVLPRYFVAPDLAAKRLRPLFPNTKLPTDWFRLIFRAGQPRENELRELASDLAKIPLR